MPEQLITDNGPPVDTSEAIGLAPSSLTVTFGFGAALFSDNGVDRLGLAKHKPAPLVDLPAFDGDALQAQISGATSACRYARTIRRRVPRDA